jgi:phage terminase small subunit
MTKSAKRKKSAEAPAWAEGLDDRETQFVREYLVDLNATQAMVRCGAKLESARSLGYDIVHRPQVSAAIDQALAENASGPRQWIIGKLANIARGNLEDLLNWDEDGRLTLKAGSTVPREIKALVRKIGYDKDGNLKLELHDPVRAMELLGKVSKIGLLTEKVDVTSGGLSLEQLVMKSLAPKEEEEKP